MTITWETAPPSLTTRQAAELLGIKRLQTISDLCQSGEIPATKVGYTMFLFTPVNPDMVGILTSLVAGTGDQSARTSLAVFLLGRSRRGTLLTVALVGLGDGPKLALAAREEMGPQGPGQEPIGDTPMTEL